MKPAADVHGAETHAMIRWRGVLDHFLPLLSFSHSSGEADSKSRLRGCKIFICGRKVQHEQQLPALCRLVCASVFPSSAFIQQRILH